TRESLDKLGNLLRGVNSYSDLDTEQRRMTRRLILCIDDTAKKVASQQGLSKSDSSNLNTLRADLNQTTEYAPTWVIVAVALALGLGTLVGWRRIVVTVGEKIGERGMGYSQGMAAQITAASAIGIASITGMPVSTTHVLSSAVAGSMLANKNRLQSGTVKSILMAWVFTLPATMLLSCALFWIASYVIL
ncbi:MAG: inorganic phosphate transporter, partial [Plesiomonas sp.]